jgi:hypothetical protein
MDVFRERLWTTAGQTYVPSFSGIRNETFYTSKRHAYEQPIFFRLYLITETTTPDSCHTQIITMASDHSIEQTHASQSNKIGRTPNLERWHLRLHTRHLDTTILNRNELGGRSTIFCKGGTNLARHDSSSSVDETCPDIFL